MNTMSVRCFYISSSLAAGKTFLVLTWPSFFSFSPAFSYLQTRKHCLIMQVGTRAVRHEIAGMAFSKVYASNEAHQSPFVLTQIPAS